MKLGDLGEIITSATTGGFFSKESTTVYSRFECTEVALRRLGPTVVLGRGGIVVRSRWAREYHL